MVIKISVRRRKTVCTTEYRYVIRGGTSKPVFGIWPSFDVSSTTHVTLMTVFAARTESTTVDTRVHHNPSRHGRAVIVDAGNSSAERPTHHHMMDSGPRLSSIRQHGPTRQRAQGRRRRRLDRFLFHATQKISTAHDVWWRTAVARCGVPQGVPGTVRTTRPRLR